MCACLVLESGRRGWGVRMGVHLHASPGQVFVRVHLTPSKMPLPASLGSPLENSNPASLAHAIESPLTS